jgi:PST family polysaccharide transporter
VTNLSSDPVWLRFIPSFIRKKITGRTNLHAAIHNSGWIFFDKILRALLGLVVGAWVARYLGPSQFGELSYCIAFIVLFQSITNLGMDGIVVREISNNVERANQLLGTVFQLRFFLGLICWAAAVLIYALFNDYSDQSIWIVVLVGASMVFQAADTVDLWFQGNSQSKRTVLAKAAAYLISNAVRVMLILFAAPLIAFAGVIAFEGALTAFALHISYRQYPSEGQWKRHLPEAKKLLKESWPYMVSGLSIILYMRIDQIMVKNILGDRELGIFAAIIPISNLWNMVPVAICVSVAPMMAKRKLEGAQVFNVGLVKLFRFFWVLSFAIIAITWLLSSFVIKLMYGQAYEEAIPVLNIYVLSCIPIFMGLGQGLWLLNERKSYLAPLQTITGAIVSIITNLIFLPLWGNEGAAVAAVISQVCSCFLINSIFARNLFIMQMGFNSKKMEE